jgi:hypothetical protein
MTTDHQVIATPGVRIIYLIKRRPTTSREELVAHWFANHMPGVIQAIQAGGLPGRHYLATLFDADRDGTHPLDGFAQVCFDQPVPAPKEPYGTVPTDSFQEFAEPYTPWSTQEYVVIGTATHPQRTISMYSIRVLQGNLSC